MSDVMHLVKVYNVPKDSKDGAIHVRKYGRNELCPCGSGKKVKNCGCGKATDRYFYIKKQKEERP